jgi:ribose-phosphate pyrophosphokinase
MIINITDGFYPFGIESEAPKSFTFPSGFEHHINIVKSMTFNGLESEEHYLTCRIEKPEDVMRILLATDAIKRATHKDAKINLVLPFIPYARQDRVMDVGEPFSLKVFTDLINSQGYNKVFVFDPHSDVSSALIDNCKVTTNYKLVKSALIAHEGYKKNDYYIVSPDAGAYKKIFGVCKYVGYDRDIIMCNKMRDVKTGKILKTVVSKEDFEGKDVIIIDDIFDGGGTFFMLAEELKKRNCGSVILIISHGLFSKGFDFFNDPNNIIERVYTTNSTKDIRHENVVQFKIDYARYDGYGIV